ncbi:MAG TPA: VanZ family protein [Chitinophagaceae bacterium]
MARLLKLFTAIIWLMFISVMFMLPASELPDESWFEKVYLDKWVHVVFFFILVYLFYRALPQNRFWRIRIVILAMIYGILVEVSQRLFTQDRSYDYSDIIADGIGCLLGMIKWKSQSKK